MSREIDTMSVIVGWLVHTYSIRSDGSLGVQFNVMSAQPSLLPFFSFFHTGLRSFNGYVLHLSFLKNFSFLLEYSFWVRGEGTETKSVLFAVFLTLESLLVYFRNADSNCLCIAQGYVCIVHGFNSQHRYIYSIYVIYTCVNVCACMCTYIYLICIHTSV